MKRINRILIPTDFSKGSKVAYEYANTLAGIYGCKIDLLHLIPTSKYFQDSLKKVGIPLSMEKDFLPEVVKDTEKSLQENMTAYINEEYRGRNITKTGPKIADAICDFAQKEKYDLILMGAQGNSAEELIHLGSVTNKVVKLSKIPVMAVPEMPAPDRIGSIIVPTDNSNESFQALRIAASLAHKMKAGITVLHVLELFGIPPEAEGETDEEKAIATLADTILNKMRKYFSAGEDDTLILNTAPEGNSFNYTDDGTSYTIPMELVIERGITAHYEIVNYANEHGDLLVISTHGRSGLSHLMLGSTAEKVIEWAEIPVLTTRIHFDK